MYFYSSKYRQIGVSQGFFPVSLYFDFSFSLAVSKDSENEQEHTMSSAVDGGGGGGGGPDEGGHHGGGGDHNDAMSRGMTFEKQISIKNGN